MSRRPWAPAPSTTAAVTAVSVAAHILVIVAIDLWGARVQGASLPGDTAATAATPDKLTLPAPSPSCEADAALGTAAQLLYCTTPLASGDACYREVLSHFAASRITCHAVAFATDVTLVSPRVLDQIEPEPLLELLDPAALEKLEQARPEPPLPEPPTVAQPAPPPPPPPDRAKQVVEITRPNDEKEPEYADLISDYNSRVDKQTVARGSTEEMVEKPKTRELPTKTQPREASIKEVPDKPSRVGDPDKPEGRGALAMRGPAGPPVEAQAEQAKSKGGALRGRDEKPSDNGLVAARGDGPASQEREKREAGGSGGGGGKPMIPNLRPSEEVLERMVGGGSVDHLDDVEQGEVTALNSKQWKYASFFNRLKRMVAQHWNPAGVYQRSDPSGNVYGARDRVTYVRVSLDPRGALAAIVVIKGSGVDVLDDEAVRAFRAATPFPNPPQALVDPQSHLITFSFGFHFEVERGNWRIFRSQ